MVLSANIYLFKVYSRSTRKKCEICSKLTVLTLFGFLWCRSGVFIVNSEHISHLFSTVYIVDFGQVSFCPVEFYLVGIFFRTDSLQDMGSSPWIPTFTVQALNFTDHIKTCFFLQLAFSFRLHERSCPNKIQKLQTFFPCFFYYCCLGV